MRGTVAQGQAGFIVQQTGHAVVAEEPLQRQKTAAEIGALLLMIVPESAPEPVPGGNNHRGPVAGSAWRERMGNFSGVSQWR